MEQPPQPETDSRVDQSHDRQLLRLRERDELRVLAADLDHADRLRAHAAARSLSGLLCARWRAAGTLRFLVSRPPPSPKATRATGMMLLPSITTGSPYTVCTRAVVCRCSTAESTSSVVLMIRSL